MSNNTTSSPGDPDHHFTSPPALSNTDYRHARWPSFGDSQLYPASGLRTKPVEKTAPPVRRSPVEVLVVGVCSSGKSTLVEKLREAGYNARACSQEHSYVPHLWQLSKPDVLVCLDASLPTIRRRRRAKWQQSVLDEERCRLAHAREHCDLYVPTDGLTPEDVASRVISFMRMRRRE